MSAAKKVLGWLRSQPVLAVAALAALASMLFVPPSPVYIGYFNWHTLLCLFAMLAVLNGLRQLGAFRALASALVERFATLRSIVLILVLVTFFGSMFLTNDMALLTFLPLAAMVLSSCGRSERILFVFVMQTLAANLGGMILPFGNPQNLFLFSYYGLDLAQFISVLFPPFAVSLVLITAICLTTSSSVPLELGSVNVPSFSRKRFAALLALFAVVVLMVFDVMPNIAGAVFVAVALLALDRGDALRHVDYALLATFACFFVFSGNLSNTPAVQQALHALLAQGAFVPGLLVSQVISNVPAVVLLAPFTSDWQGLLLGVDIGGLGTPIASLASLITLAEFNRCIPGRAGKFLLVFTICNVVFLVALVAFVLAVSLA